MFCGELDYNKLSAGLRYGVQYRVLCTYGTYIMSHAQVPKCLICMYRPDPNPDLAWYDDLPLQCSSKSHLHKTRDVFN